MKRNLVSEEEVECHPSYKPGTNILFDKRVDYLLGFGIDKNLLGHYYVCFTPSSPRTSPYYLYVVIEEEGTQEIKIKEISCTIPQLETVIKNKQIIVDNNTYPLKYLFIPQSSASTQQLIFSYENQLIESTPCTSRGYLLFGFTLAHAKKTMKAFTPPSIMMRRIAELKESDIRFTIQPTQTKNNKSVCNFSAYYEALYKKKMEK